MIKNKVCVIGLGYVGLPILVSVGNTGKYKAFGFDVDKRKISMIKKRENPIDDEYVSELLKTSQFEVSDQDDILKGAEFVIIAVPTPVLDDYTPDYRFVVSAGETVAKYLEKGQKIILESTVNPGVTEEILIPILEKASNLKPGKDYHVGYCPERIDPGSPKWNVSNINRNLSATSKSAANEIYNFYKSYITADINIVSSLKAAEATKIVENTFRDVNIAFVNEIAKSFDKLGIDVAEVIEGASNKPFGYMPFYPSVGVGGHCIPVDPYYLIERAEQAGFNHRFLKLAREINNSMPEYTIELLVQQLNEIEKSVKGTKVLILGMSYKANVGDMRESPSEELVELLENLGAELSVYDPHVEKFNNYKNLVAALKGQAAVILATDHAVFLEQLTPALLKKSQVKVFIDGKNKLNPHAVKKAGIRYSGIGRQ